MTTSRLLLTCHMRCPRDYFTIRKSCHGLLLCDCIAICFACLENVCGDQFLTCPLVTRKFCATSCDERSLAKIRGGAALFLSISSHRDDIFIMSATSVLWISSHCDSKFTTGATRDWIFWTSKSVIFKIKSQFFNQSLIEGRGCFYHRRHQ